MWWRNVELPEQEVKQAVTNLSADELKNKLIEEYKEFHWP